MKVAKGINLNKIAKEVARREGKKRQVNIAQIKEVLRHTLDILADIQKDDDCAVYEFLCSRIKGKG